MIEKESISELWAVLDKNGNIMLSRGGSSTKKKIMVYPSEDKANRALKSPWIKQVIDVDEVIVRRIYYITKGRYYRMKED